MKDFMFPMIMIKKLDEPGEAYHRDRLQAITDADVHKELETFAAYVVEHVYNKNFEGGGVIREPSDADCEVLSTICAHMFGIVRNTFYTELYYAKREDPVMTVPAAVAAFVAAQAPQHAS